MNIKTFQDEVAANDFADSVKVKETSYQDGKFVVTYSPFFTEAQLLEGRIKNEWEQTMSGLQQARLQLKFLEVIEEPSEEEKKAIETTKANLKFYENRMKVVDEELAKL